MINFIFRLLTLFPDIILCILFGTIIISNQGLKGSVRNNWKLIAISSTVLGLAVTLLLIRHFSIENTIYTYDYAGQWIRTLELKEMFQSNPASIFKKVYYSINHSEYSYLPALLLLPAALCAKGTYLQFCLSILWIFLVPFYAFFSLLYLTYTDRARYIPLLIGTFFVPLYTIIFFNEVGSVGFFYVLYAAYVFFVKDPRKLNKYDFWGTNASALMLLFTRRYYLYYVFAMYVLFLFRVVTIMVKDKKYDKELAIKTVSTGIYALIIVLTLFLPYVISVLGNNFKEAYEAFDHSGKVYELIKFYGPICFVLSIIGTYDLIKNDQKWLAFFTVASVIIICLLFWRIQFFEAHHYSLLTVQMLVLTACGVKALDQKNVILGIIAIMLLGIQTINSFVSFTDSELLSSSRITPYEYTEMETVTEIVDMVRETVDEDKKIWFAFGDSHFNSDIIRNRYLPDLSHRFPSKEYSYDIRDGFPDLNEFDFVMIAEPGLYINPNYQHIYDVVKEAILNEPAVNKHFRIVNYAFMSSSYLEIYERISDLDQDAKQYLYDRMIEFYPDKTEFFSYLLD